MSVIGWVHTLLGVAALAVGCAALLRPKGGRRHRLIGRAYLGCMLALNLSSFAIMRLFGGFGPFHWMALASLATLLVGVLPARLRRPAGSWRALHAAGMSGSYVGLVAAAAAEVTSRMAPGAWALAVVGTSATVIAAGLALIAWLLPRALRRPGGDAPSAGGHQGG